MSTSSGTIADPIYVACMGNPDFDNARAMLQEFLDHDATQRARGLAPIPRDPWQTASEGAATLATWWKANAVLPGESCQCQRVDWRLHALDCPARGA